MRLIRSARFWVPGSVLEAELSCTGTRVPAASEVNEYQHQQGTFYESFAV